MRRKATSAELRALRPNEQSHGARIPSTNSVDGHGHGGRQSRVTSLAEAVANVVACYLVALLAQQAILPLFAIHLSIAAHAGLAAIFTLLSLMRSYLLRRLFDYIDERRRREEAERQERLHRAFSRGRI